MCRDDFEGVAMQDAIELVAADDGGVGEMKAGMMLWDVGSERSERFDRKLRDVVMILTLVGLMVVTVPLGVSPKYGHVHGGGRSKVPFVWLLFKWCFVVGDSGGLHLTSGTGISISSTSRSSLSLVISSSGLR